MSYQIPETVNLYDLRVARLDHFTVYTDEPREGEEKPPHGSLYAYYRIGDETRRIQLGMKMVKFSPAQLPSAIATLFLKS